MAPPRGRRQGGGVRPGGAAAARAAPLAPARPGRAATPERPAADTGDTVALAQTVRAALRTLPPGQRAVLVLRYYEQRSETEIVDLLRCSPGTVKSRASRALRRLRESGLLDDEPLENTPDQEVADGHPS